MGAQGVQTIRSSRKSGPEGIRKLLVTGRYSSIRIFKNPFLEKLTHVHPLTPLALWTPVIAWMFGRSFERADLATPSLAAIVVSGLLFWTLAEYVLHRYVFHLRLRGPRADRFQFLIHGLHHDDPNDPTRLVMPPAPGIILGLFFYALFTAVLGRSVGEPFFASFLIGYLAYDYIHFYVHHFTPKTRVGKFLKQSHMLHHYKNPESRWGVSSPLWDFVFGTLDRR